MSDLLAIRRLEAEIDNRMFLLLKASAADLYQEQMIQCLAHAATRSAWLAAKYGPNEAYARLPSGGNP